MLPVMRARAPGGSHRSVLRRHSRSAWGDRPNEQLWSALFRCVLIWLEGGDDCIGGPTAWQFPPERIAFDSIWARLTLVGDLVLRR